MIRRRIGDRWLLFTQDDHARMAADLAAHVGAGGFEGTDQPAVLRAIALHDCGWTSHDNQPTLNPAGEPLDVFEGPRNITLPAWAASAEHAAAEDAYSGLLVSLHALALSAYAASVAEKRPYDEQLHSARARFAMNQFQHAQIELQETLRKRLGLRVDRPLKLGLAEGSTDRREQQLSADFRLLQAMDQLSLDLLCTEPPAPVLKLHPQPGAPLTNIVFRRIDGHTATLSPWIFRSDQVHARIPCRILPAETFADVEAFRAAYAAAQATEMTFRLRR